MKKTDVEIMFLAEVAKYFHERGLSQTGVYFEGLFYDRDVVRGMIEVDAVRRHVGDQIMRDLLTEVSTQVSATPANVNH